MELITSPCMVTICGLFFFDYDLNILAEWISSSGIKTMFSKVSYKWKDSFHIGSSVFLFTLVTCTSSAARCFSKSKGLTSFGMQVEDAMPVRLSSEGIQPIMQNGSLLPIKNQTITLKST